jgi:NTP pyrophosphatase (non-canonical NTP hydrolase)
MQKTPEDFCRDALRELDRAKTKFPFANLAGLALMEEVGELAQACLKWRAGKWPHERVYEEAIQVAVMAMRVALENDDSLHVSYSEPK